ncbi:eukaryotic mitochondrial regulator protein [Hirsutella rhossiliensis]|uniref:Eukaryotic mitochondrial regulator protein n=1 Tax=Hirsutella rhossiliensis TaxID=111463 RepID=A0A9P8SDM6_9HYPO|nr:eukaryotic mitochondrial regulator protein [Hirsutella rhossiliensis]KAH0958908.1 eukaryotic mitochondrial regulator protein [Hirsutella rhossiliensis]
MPPRIRAPSVSLATDVVLQQPRPWTTLSGRAFSATPCLDKMSRARQKMYQWIQSRKGRELAEPGRGPRYLGPHRDQPFPLNPLFRSLPVLDDSTKELIWDKVMKRGESLKAVSAEMNVDVRRVAAVVRLKEVQRQWEKDGKKLATPYAKAVMSMLPKTTFREGERNAPHEAVNEIHVHTHTMQQLFVPVSESRHFTREDAAKAFHSSLLSADARSPQPRLIDMEREISQGKDRDEALIDFKEATQKEEEALAHKMRLERERQEKMTTRVRTDRCEFRFKQINVQDVGRLGRSREGTGWRYGAPLQDRKRGLVKIPTSVP